MVDIKKRNRLRKEATAWAKKNPNSGLFGHFPSRSCWKCNGAHEHLKKADYPIQCFACGHIYFKGVQLSEERKAPAREG